MDGKAVPARENQKNEPFDFMFAFAVPDNTDGARLGHVLFDQELVGKVELGMISGEVSHGTPAGGFVPSDDKRARLAKDGVEVRDLDCIKEITVNGHKVALPAPRAYVGAANPRPHRRLGQVGGTSEHQPERSTATGIEASRRGGPSGLAVKATTAGLRKGRSPRSPTVDEVGGARTGCVHAIRTRRQAAWSERTSRERPPIHGRFPASY